VPPCQSTAATAPNATKPTTLKNSARVRARCTATPTSREQPRKRASLRLSRVKLCTVRMAPNDSSAMPIASAMRSCTPVLALRSERPKKIAAPTTSGTTASVVSVRRKLVTNIMIAPPTRKSDWRDSSDTHVLSSDCSNPDHCSTDS
jgi:hypothetical protein